MEGSEDRSVSSVGRFLFTPRRIERPLFATDHAYFLDPIPSRRRQKVPKRNKKRRRVSKLKANDYGIHLLVGIKGPRAWKVTIYRDGRTFNRLFSFSRYSGRDPARQAADA